MSFAKNLRDLVKSNRQTGSNKLVASSNASSATSAPSSSSSVLSNITESSGIVSVSKTNFSTKPKSPDSGVSSRAQTPAVQASARSLSTGIVGDAEDQDDDISTPRQSLESAIGRIEQLNLDFTREDSAVPPTPRCFTARSRDLVGEIDRLMAYVDADVVHDYLQRSNQILRSLRLWFNSESQLPAPKSRSTRATDSVSTRGGNFLEFVHFWLTEFPGVERQELLRLEYENLCDELGFVFRVADTSSATRSSGELTTETISRASLHRLLEVVLPEYPGELCRANGAHRFLEMLDTLCCARNARFRNILSRLFTPNSATARSLSSSARSVASASSSSSSAAANQEAEVHPAFRKHMKWLLAIRAFAVLSFTQSPVEMFRNLQSMKPSHMAPASRPTQGPESSAAPSPIDPLDLIHLAIEYEHTDALLYVLRSRYESALLFEDPEGHNIIFLLIQRRKATLIESVLKQVRLSLYKLVFEDTTLYKVHSTLLYTRTVLCT